MEFANAISVLRQVSIIKLPWMWVESYVGSSLVAPERACATTFLLLGVFGKYGSTGVCWPMTHFTIGVYDIVELGCIDDGLSEVSAFNSDPYGVGCIQNDISGMNTEANYMNNNSTIIGMRENKVDES
ncbi:hypothetical protein AFLA70_151g001812 [Aspergillus flavus AF70]|nr:hypothetical protein AFLA70_151g001812 [Aspergillus flavus AF70]